MKLIHQDQVLMKIMNIKVQEQQERNGIFKADQRICKVSILIKNKILFIEPLEIALKRSSPGPGTYDPATEMNKTGVYSVSTM